LLFDTVQYHLVLIAVLVNGVVNIKLLHQCSLWCLQISSATCANTIWGLVLLALLNIWLLLRKKYCITNAVNGTECTMLWDNSNFDHRGVRSDFKNTIDSRVWNWMPKCRGKWIEIFISRKFLPLYWLLLVQRSFTFEYWQFLL